MDTVTEDIRIDGRTVVSTRPVGEGPWPGVVMLHEALGIDDVLRRQADRLAQAGYVVLAPDLFGEGSWLGCIITAFRAMRARQGRPFEVIQASRHQLLYNPRCTGKVGVIGFCMGGGFALLLGNHGFDASSVNYGMIPKDLDQALRGSCAMVGSFGARDTMLAKQVPWLQETLTRLDIPHDVKVYPTAGHSFLNDAENVPKVLRPIMRAAGVGPDPEAAVDAWERIEAFFGTHLGPDSRR